MKRILVLGGLVTVAGATIVVAAHALPLKQYRGHVPAAQGSLVKLRLEPAGPNSYGIVRSFVVRYFDVGCPGGLTTTLRRARLRGEVPVGHGGGFHTRADNGETVFNLRGRFNRTRRRARGTFRYSGSIDVGGRIAECDSGRLAWKARPGAGR